MRRAGREDERGRRPTRDAAMVVLASTAALALVLAVVFVVRLIAALT